MQRKLIWDSHTCLPLHPDVDIGILERHLDSGTSFVSVNVGMDMNPIEQIMAVISSFRKQIATHPKMIQVESISDVERAHQDRKLAIAFDLEGAIPLLERPEMVELYYDLGVRQIHLAYNRNNAVAGGCHDEDTGLTDLGRRMVSAINQAGMIIDVSHTGYTTTLDIFACSETPVVFSHSNPDALLHHRRNITDEQMKGCASTGGVVCLNGVGRFLGTRELGIAPLLRHVTYVAELIGTEHVGLGIDTMFQQEGIDDTPPNFDAHYWWPPEDYKAELPKMTFIQPESFPEIIGGLSKLGFSESEVDQIVGLNMYGIAEQTWKP